VARTRHSASINRAGRDLVELVKSGKAYVKISGAYRLSKQGPDYPDAAPFARALIAANADRIVWGTDWPHPNSVTPPDKKADRSDAAVPDRRRPSAQPAPGVAPDAAIRKKILVDNPASFYGFLDPGLTNAPEMRRRALTHGCAGHCGG